MSKWCEALPGILIFSFLLSGLPGKAVASNAPVTVNYLVVDEKTHPFQIVSEEGLSHGGIISDIVEAVFADSSYAVKHHVMPVNRVRQSVIDLKIQNWIAFDAPAWNSFGDKGERVGEPLFETRHVLMTCNAALPTKVDSLDDLAGLSIVTLRNFDYLQLNKVIEEGLVRSIPVDRYAVGLELVREGRVDGFIEMVSRLRYHRTQLEGDHSCIREIDVSAIIPNFPIYLTVDSSWPITFKQFVAQRLEEMAGAGELKQIFDRYVPVDGTGQSSTK